MKEGHAQVIDAACLPQSTRSNYLYSTLSLFTDHGNHLIRARTEFHSVSETT